MPILIIRAVECRLVQFGVAEPAATLGDPDEVRLVIDVDGQHHATLARSMNTYERWVIDREVSFTSQVRLTIEEHDPIEDDRLGRHTIGPELVPRGSLTFDEDGADYRLWYEVIDAERRHQIGPELSVRRMLGRGQPGVLPDAIFEETVAASAIWRAAEVVSFREVVERHAVQDGAPAGLSLREWVEAHCNLWGDEVVIAPGDLPEALPAGPVSFEAQWKPVEDEGSRMIAGLVTESEAADNDYFAIHETLDWNFEHYLDPGFAYMLGYTNGSVRAANGWRIPLMHNEWETGSMPYQWRPFAGEYVTAWGRHIFDAGHMPVKTELHPIHTIIRERTSASRFGESRGPWIPVNVAVVGMGLSGGFPFRGSESPSSRWRAEFGGARVGDDQQTCWPTNLAHASRTPLRFRLFPPNERPDGGEAVLRCRVVRAEIITAAGWDDVNDFLDLCQRTNPQDRGRQKAFRIWSATDGLPHGYTPRDAEVAARPQVTIDGGGAEVAIDLSSVPGIVLGYHAELECGWDRPDPSQPVRAYDVTFERLKVLRNRYGLDDEDWRFYYGVNGLWQRPWYQDDGIDEGRTYDFDRRIRVYVMNELPLVIRDCGIEWNGHLSDNLKLARVELTAPGPDHLRALHDLRWTDAGVSAAHLDGDRLTMTVASAFGTGDDSPEHSWELLVERVTP